MSDELDMRDKAAWDAAEKVADYEHGWSSDIETDFAPKGLTEASYGELTRRISSDDAARLAFEAALARVTAK